MFMVKFRAGCMHRGSGRAMQWMLGEAQSLRDLVHDPRASASRILILQQGRLVYFGGGKRDVVEYFTREVAEVRCNGAEDTRSPQVAKMTRPCCNSGVVIEVEEHHRAPTVPGLHSVGHEGDAEMRVCGLWLLTP